MDETLFVETGVVPAPTFRSYKWLFARPSNVPASINSIQEGGSPQEKKFKNFENIKRKKKKYPNQPPPQAKPLYYRGTIFW